MKVCNIPGCPTLTDQSRCTAHRTTQRRARVGNQIYSSAEHRTFRTAVLRRDPVCVTPGCHAPSTVADHYPLNRRELVSRHLDPNDPSRGRGLCARHHNQHTARTTPGGWAATTP